MRLLAAAPGRLPLIRTDFEPAGDPQIMRSQDAAILFPGARQQQAALAGLLLRLGRWPESHAVAQDIESAEGSYWHGIIHRLEPDSSNAKYWFRRVGKHAIFVDLHQRAAQILQRSGPRHWHLKNAWDPSLFIEWCDEAHLTGGTAEETAIEIQLAEWQLLFEWCAFGDSQRHP